MGQGTGSRRSRLLRAIVAALLVGGLVAGALAYETLAASETQRQESARPFAFAALRVGDRAEYSRSTIGHDGAPLVPEAPAYSVEVLADRTFPGRDHLLHDIHEILVQEPTTTGPLATIWSFDASDGELFAWSSSETVATHAMSGTPGRSVDTVAHVRTVHFADDASSTPPCLMPLLAGRTIPMPGAIVLFSTCALESRSLGGSLFSLTGRGRDGSADLARFDSADATAWFSSEFPLPLRLAHADPEGTLHVMRLSAFDAGLGDALARAGPSQALDLPPIEWRPATQVGLDETGSGHPFPLSKAFAAARSSPTNGRGVEKFLADHPRAVVVRASFFESRQVLADPVGPAARDLRWDLFVSDGNEGLALCVYERIEAPNPAASRLLGPPAAEGTVVTDLLPCGVGSPIVHFDLSLRPASMPTVASMERQWATFAQAIGAASGASNAYGLSLVCGDTACKDVTFAFTAGLRLTDYVYRDDTSSTTRTTLRDLRLDPEGRLAAWSEEDRRQEIGVGSPVVRHLATTQPDVALTSVAGVASWDLPRTWAAASGMAAAAAALLAWFAPSLKRGLWTLYSRVVHENALDHPARARLLGMVEADPGIHFSELMRRMELGRSSTEHHLCVLMGAGLLSQQSGVGYTCYFRKGAVDRRVMAAASLLKSTVAQQVFASLSATQGLSISDLARSSGVSRVTVRYHLARLAKAGLVDVEAAASGSFATLTELGIFVRAKPVATVSLPGIITHLEPVAATK